MEQKVLEIIEKALDEISPMIESNYVFDSDLRLMGSKGILDSIALVSLISTLEEMMSDELDKDIMLVTDKAFAKGNNPFYSVSSLCQFIVGLCNE